MYFLFVPLMLSNGIDASSPLFFRRCSKAKTCRQLCVFGNPACGRTIYFSICLFFSQVTLHGLKELMGLGLLIFNVLKSKTDAPQSVGLLWTSCRAVTENSFSQHNPHMRQASKTLAGFKPIIPAIERPQNGTLDRMAKSIGKTKFKFKFVTGRFFCWFRCLIKSECNCISTEDSKGLAPYFINP
jgi:hypothetical protein